MTFLVSQALKDQAIKKRVILLGLTLTLLSLGGCRSDKVTVDAKDPNAPQFAYRKDELALLQMSADDIQELERDKRYGTIYDDYASDSFKKGVGRRQFMIMSNCVESFLGDLEEYDRNDIGFRREFLKGKTQPKDQSKQPYIDVLNRKVHRALGSIEEQLVFVPNGLSFQLNGLYWIAKDKTFLRCMAESGQLDAQTSPKPETLPDGSESPAVSEPAERQSPKTADTESAGTSPSASQQGQNTPTVPATRSTNENQNAPIPVDGTSGLEAKPVQPMKPAEIKKAPLKARPAGAGAVVDQRPVSQNAKAEQQAEEEANKRRIELESKTEQTVPLPTTGGSDD